MQSSDADMRPNPQKVNAVIDSLRDQKIYSIIYRHIYDVGVEHNRKIKHK